MKRPLSTALGVVIMVIALIGSVTATYAQYRLHQVTVQQRQYAQRTQALADCQAAYNMAFSVAITAQAVIAREDQEALGAAVASFLTGKTEQDTINTLHTYQNTEAALAKRRADHPLPTNHC